MCIIEELKKVSRVVNYEGYYYKLSDVVEILILGLLCRLQTLKDIHEWSESEYVRETLREKFRIKDIPCY